MGSTLAASKSTSQRQETRLIGVDRQRKGSKNIQPYWLNVNSYPPVSARTVPANQFQPWLASARCFHSHAR